MARRSTVSGLGCALAVSMGACGTGATREVQPAQPATTTVTPSPATAPPPAAAPTGPTGRLADVVVKLEYVAQSVRWTIQNHGDAPVELSRQVTVEAKRGEDFTLLDGTELEVRWDCARAAEPCVTLAPGAELEPPAWLAKRGLAQCDCASCTPLEAGSYRFVLRSCNRASELRTDAIDLPR